MKHLLLLWGRVVGAVVGGNFGDVSVYSVRKLEFKSSFVSSFLLCSLVRGVRSTKYLLRPNQTKELSRVR